MKEELVYCGVDIAKLFLDVAIKNEKRRLANDATGHRQLINWLKEVEDPVQVICEPSGGYERGLVQALVRGQIKVSLVQANRVRQICQGQWHFSQDRSDRCAGAVRFWSSDEAADAERVQFGATAVARVGESTAALNPSASDGAKSRRSLG